MQCKERICRMGNCGSGMVLVVAGIMVTGEGDCAELVICTQKR